MNFDIERELSMIDGLDSMCRIGSMSVNTQRQAYRADIDIQRFAIFRVSVVRPGKGHAMILYCTIFFRLCHGLWIRLKSRQRIEFVCILS